jgi:hypothetical protein
VPAAVGVNVTLMGQVAFDAIEEHEPPGVAANAEGFDPPRLTPVMFALAPNVLLTVIVAAALAIFKVWDPKDALVGERLTPPTPVPDKVNAGLGVLGSLSEIVKLPAAVPAVVGVNIT